MEDSFRVRVDKAFGSLFSASSSNDISTTTSSMNCSSSSLSSLWCLTDDEIERREWKKDYYYSQEEDAQDNLSSNFRLQPKFGPSQETLLHGLPTIKPLVPDFHKDLESDLQQLSDDGAEEEDEDKDDDDYPSDGDNKGLRQRHIQLGGLADEEEEIRSSIGLDCTLDYEEDEDEYDKVAVGKKMFVGDRVYMRDINDYGIDIDTDRELPDSFHDVHRDPRANHAAARLRLEEDAKAAGGMQTLNLSDTQSTHHTCASLDDKSEDGVKPKTILKKRDSRATVKSPKRVRFDDPKSDEDCARAKTSLADTCSIEEVTATLEGVSGASGSAHAVPDYIRNPSNYIHYTFDSSMDVNEESNRKAYMDVFSLLRKPNTPDSQLLDTSVHFSKSIAFAPKKNLRDPSTVMTRSGFNEDQEDNSKKVCSHVAISIGDAQESDISAMEEDEPQLAVSSKGSLRKLGRQYRAKTRGELNQSAK